MKVALINPPSPFLINERVFPNVGIVRVATALKRDGHDVSVLDYAGTSEKSVCEEDMKRIAWDYDWYGFSSTTPQFPYISKMHTALRKVNPKVRTVIGGAHASAMSSLKRRGIEDINMSALEKFDVVYEGEGENLEHMFEPGWQRGEVIKNIDDTPIPDMSFINLKSYHYLLNGKVTTNIQTQRGCPALCTFCSGRNIDMYKRVRTHSPERVLEEMDVLHDKYGYDSFMWYDDEVNINIGRLEALCSALSTRPYQHRGFVRSDIVYEHPQSVRWLKKAGFVKICAGVESGSNRILKEIKKGITNEQNLYVRRLFGEEKMHYETFLLMGLPTETKKDVVMTEDFIREAKPDDFDINIVVPYPGSHIYDDAIPSDKFKGYNWEYKGLYFNKPDYSKEESHYKGIGGKGMVHSRTDDMSEEYLQERREEIEKLKCIK